MEPVIDTGGPPPADAALVAAARTGDRSAFALLVDRHRAGLLAACGRLLRDDALAEDAAQEAVVTAYVELGRLRQPERFGAWLVGIGLNVGRRWLRARLREAAPAADGTAVESAAAIAPGPDEVAEARALADRVRRAVMALPAGQRAAVMGFYLVGLPQREVAALLGTSVGAVKTRLHKARSTLATALAGELDGEGNETMTTNEATVPMQVAEVCRLGTESPGARHAVVLAEVGGDRELPIWVGEPEGTALAAALAGADLPRPMTHRLTAELLQAGGVAVRGVRLTELAERTFYATVTVEGASGEARVDARPSDALTLALLAAAPIAVDEQVLRAAEIQQRDEGVATAAQVRARAQQFAGDIAAEARARWERLQAELHDEG